MNSIQRPYPVALATCVAVLFAVAVAQGGSPAQQRGAGLIGGALPGGAVLSSAVQGAKLVTLTPTGGGAPASAALGADGSFGFEGLAPGRYQLSLQSQRVPKQTQAPSFGERAKPGVARSAAAAGDTAVEGNAAKINSINAGMPNRISMNVTVARRTLAADVDGPAVEVEVGADGKLSGLAQPAPVAAPAATPAK
jgi:hypothetical protein